MLLFRGAGVTGRAPGRGGRQGGRRRIGGVPYGMLLFRGARFTGRASERAARRRSGTITFDTKVTHLGCTRVRNPYYNTVTGPGTPLFPPPRNGGPAFFLPLIHPG